MAEINITINGGNNLILPNVTELLQNLCGDRPVIGPDKVVVLMVWQEDKSTEEISIT